MVTKNLRMEIPTNALQNWSDDDINLQKMWHNNYNIAWNLFMNKTKTI